MYEEEKLTMPNSWKKGGGMYERRKTRCNIKSMVYSLIKSNGIIYQ